MGKQNKIKISALSLIIIAVVTATNIKAQVPDWFVKLKKVEVLHSTRQDVEKNFNSSKIHSERVLKFYTVVQYDLIDGDLEVYYSNGRCSDNKDSIWDVNTGTVLKMFFNPFDSIKPSKLKIKLRDYQKEVSTDNPNIMYSNNKLGVKYTVSFDKVSVIEFYSTDEQNTKLYCPNK